MTETNPTKTIKTLVKDIQTVLAHGVEINEDQGREFGNALAKIIIEKLSPSNRKPNDALRMSNLGAPDRKLWYTVNEPEMAEPLDADTYLKFLIGDVYEAVLLFLARAAGHTVTHEQVEVEVNGIKGHPDALIDGELTDVKSASGFGMNKFKRNELVHNDPFNYIFQIKGYLGALQDDDALKVKDVGHFLVGDKSSGELVLDSYKLEASKAEVEAIVERKKSIVALSDPPPRCYPSVPDGASGNMKLGTECSYCVFKKHCWPEARVFAYSNGPRYLTKVVRLPDVPEIK